MNVVVLSGRLTKDPDIWYGTGENPICVARYTLAVDRKRKPKEGEQNADFISIKAFGNWGELAEKYYKKGMRVIVQGRIETGSYTNKDGQKVYTTDVIVEYPEFAESKKAASSSAAETDEGGFVETTPDEEELPFS